MKRIQKGRHTKKSSSCAPTAPSSTPKDVLDLGRELVAELGLEPGVDTLSRWMAHHIAELIQEVETAKAEERSAKLAKCADAILRLWERRHQLPNGKRPFENLEPILRALESLDPTDETPRYFRSQRKAADEMEQNHEAKSWLDLADGLDYSAKVLIRYCISQAAQAALDTSRDWVELGKAIGLEDDIEFPVIRFVTQESDLLKAADPVDKARKVIEDRVKRLEGFVRTADAFVSELRRQLK